MSSVNALGQNGEKNSFFRHAKAAAKALFFLVLETSDLKFLKSIFLVLKDKIHGQSFGTNIKAHFCAKVQSSFMGQTIPHYLQENIDVSFVGQKSRFIFFGTRRKLFREIQLHIREKFNNSNFKELCERFQKQSPFVNAKGNPNFTVMFVHQPGDKRVEKMFRLLL